MKVKDLRKLLYELAEIYRCSPVGLPNFGGNGIFGYPTGSALPYNSRGRALYSNHTYADTPSNDNEVYIRARCGSLPMPVSLLFLADQLFYNEDEARVMVHNSQTGTLSRVTGARWNKQYNCIELITRR